MVKRNLQHAVSSTRVQTTGIWLTEAINPPIFIFPLKML